MGQWIEENIQMLKNQTFENFQMIIVDDMSTDDSVALTRAAIKNDDRFKLIVNQEKRYKSRNVVEAIKAARPDDEDVLVLVDGDDRLAHKNVLQNLYDVYQQKKCWMTYGSYENSEGVKYKRCHAYQDHIIKNNSYRKAHWLASHLKTFKYGLWKKLDMDVMRVSEEEKRQALMRALFKLQFRRWYHWKTINLEDLHDPSGKFTRRVDDKGFTLPMLEMAGDRACFIEEVLYVFRTPQQSKTTAHRMFGNQNSKKWHTRLIRDVHLNKRPYKRLERL